MKCIFNTTINHEAQDNPDYLNEFLNVFLFSDSVFVMRFSFVIVLNVILNKCL